MRYLYMLIALLFLGLGVFYLYHEDKSPKALECPFCAKSVRSSHEGAAIFVMEPKVQVVHGHLMLYTHRHIESLEEISFAEKQEMISLFGDIDRQYLQMYGTVGHTYFVNVSDSGHLFLEVIPKMGFRPYVYFKMMRFLRLFQPNKKTLILEAKPVTLSVATLN